MRAILLAFDRLPAWRLGCYGNFDTATPTFDDFASQSAVFDQAFRSPDGPSWAERLSGNGMQAAWVRVADEAEPVEAGMTRVPLSRVLNDDIETDPLPADLWDKDLVLIEIADPPSAATLTHTEDETSDDADLDPMEIKDAVLHALLRLILPRLTDDDLLIVLGGSGDPQEDPSDNPDWLKSVGDAAARIPLLIHAADPETVGRYSSFVRERDLAELIRTHVQGTGPGLNAWRKGLLAEEIRYSSRDAAVARTRNWAVVERTSSPPPASTDIPPEETPPQLFRQPGDPWFVLNVAGEHVELMEEYGRGERE